MHAPLLATRSRTSRPSSDPTNDDAPCPPASWSVRIVQAVLAVYLLPVLALVLLIGGVGMVVVGLASLAARTPFWRNGPNDPEVEECVSRS